MFRLSYVTFIGDSVSLKFLLIDDSWLARFFVSHRSHESHRSTRAIACVYHPGCKHSALADSEGEATRLFVRFVRSV